MPQAGITNEKIVETTKKLLQDLKNDRKIVDQLKKEMLKYGTSMGETQKIINQKLSVEELSPYVVCQLMVSIYNVTQNGEANPSNYYTPQEIKQATSYEFEKEEVVKLPYTFRNVNRIKQDHYQGTITAQEIKKLWDSKIFRYNFETQRESAYKRTDEGIIQVPKLNQRHVKEMVALIKSGELISSVLTFNARLGTADSGIEVEYDTDERTLTINEGTYIDVLDGFHRITSVISALSEDPTLDMVFQLNVLNYSTRMAQKYFAQMNTFTEISKSRLEDMAQKRQSDQVVRLLQGEGVLEGKVSLSDNISATAGHLVTFSLLSSVIDETFSPQNPVEARNVAKYLGEFFEELFYNYPEHFVNSSKEMKENSLMNANQMFNGYVVLAHRMQKENIPLTKLKNILDGIDFSRTNKMWQEMGVLDEKLNITSNPKNKIKTYFKNIDINGVLSHV